MRPFRGAILALAALFFALAACTTPTAGPGVVRLDTLAPSAGAPGTVVEVTGRIPAGAALHLCGVPLAGLLLSDPETAAASHFGRASGAVPPLTPGSTCTLTVVRGGQTLPHAGATLTFTTSLVATAPVAPTNLGATPGNASVAIAFSVPDDGGSPVVRLQFSLDGGVSWSDAAATTSPLRLTGLANDQPVTVRLRVLNAVGAGPASGPVTATPSLWPFASGSGGAGDVVAEGVSTLPDGSAIVTGDFGGAASFGATTLTSAGSDDVFVARADPSGAWTWATRAGGASSDRAAGVSALADGGAIVAGTFRGTAAFGASTLVSAGGPDLFVARIDPSGVWTWATRAGGTGDVRARGVSALADGGAIVAGTFDGAATFGAATLVGAGGLDLFVARVDANGSWVWATRAGGTGFVSTRAVGTFADGGAIVAGTFGGTATFGASSLVSVGAEDVFVARTNPDGSWAWATRAGGPDFQLAAAVDTLADGSGVVSGYFSGITAFGGTTLISAGSADVFVAKTRPDGGWDWATRAGGTGSAVAEGVSALADGGALTAGSFSGTATFGAITLVGAGSSDVFVAKTDGEGGWVWAARAGGSGAAAARSVSALSDDSAVIAGTFGGTATFGATTLTTAAEEAAFVAKVDAGVP